LLGWSADFGIIEVLEEIKGLMSGNV